MSRTVMTERRTAQLAGTRPRCMSLSNQLFTSLKPKGPFSCLFLLTCLLVLACPSAYVCVQQHAVRHVAKQISNQCLCRHTAAVKRLIEHGLYTRKVLTSLLHNTQCSLRKCQNREEERRVRCSVFSNSLGYL